MHDLIPVGTDRTGRNLELQTRNGSPLYLWADGRMVGTPNNES